jgi:hypothetical protein
MVGATVAVSVVLSPRQIVISWLAISVGGCTTVMVMLLMRGGQFCRVAVSV